MDNFTLQAFDPVQGINPILGYNPPAGNYQLYMNWKNWIPLTDTINKVNVYFMASGRTASHNGVPNQIAVYRNKPLGGLRIASIESDFGNQVSRKYYKYTMPGEPSKSSGVLTSAPVYEYIVGLPIAEGMEASGYATFLLRTSNSNAPLATTAGSYVEYEYVHELLDEAVGQGETLSHFTTSREFPDINNFSAVYPFAPYLSNDYKRGRLLEQTSYKRENEILYPVKKTINSYQTKGFASSPSVKMGCLVRQLNVHRHLLEATTYSTSCEITAIAPYTIATEFPYLSSTIERNYSADTTKFIDTFTRYRYEGDQHFQLTSSSTVNAEGDTLITKLSYPTDYAITHTDTEGLTIKKMQQDFRISSPIETLQLKKTSGGTSVLGASLSLYQMAVDPATADTLVVPYQVSQLNIASPIALSSFVPFVPYAAKDVRYQTRLTYNQYDTKGNVLMVTTDSNKVMGYQWGYNKQYPIASAQHASAAEFYFNGFEEGAGSGLLTGNAHTGKKYTTNNSITWIRPNARNYVISYWYLSAGKWKLAPETAYIGTSFTLSGGSGYDDVRIYPVDAMVSTYTYDPLVGMTSQTDAKGLTTVYEYDDFQRLLTISDHNGDVIKTMSYNYGSNVNITPAWTDTNVKSCEQSAPGVYTGIELMQQVDTNPYSTSHDTYRTRIIGPSANCQPTIYARISEENLAVASRRTKADIVVRFFSDAACTIPVSVSGLSVSFEEVDDLYELVSSSSVIANGSSAVIATQAIIQENNPSGVPVSHYYFLLTSAPGYTISH